MVPLSLSSPGEKVVVRSIGGTGHIAKTLGHLGIITGTELTIIRKNKDSLIVRIGESRYALGPGAAGMVLVDLLG